MIKKLEKIFEQNKDNIAYKVGDQYITYNQLWIRANELAASLKCQGTDAIIIYGHKSIEMVVSILGCLISNRAYIPIDLHTPDDRINKIIEMTNASLVIKNEELNISNIECLDIESINKSYKTSVTKDTSFNEIAYIIFTSGSIGTPKGVPISYNNLKNFIDWISNLKPLNAFNKINVLNQASFSFDLSVADFYYSIFNGHTIVALEKELQNDFKSVFNLIKSEKINLMVMTPTFIKMLLLSDEFNSECFPDIKCMYFCGEQLEVITVKKIKERFPSIDIINAYGPTEATSAVSAIIIDDEMLEKDYLPVGDIKTSAVNISIVKDEIVLKGDSVFNGYIGDYIGGYYKEGNVNCYLTGDIGYIENDLLYCKGRIDNQIKYKGYRIELGDIENNLLKIDGIREAVVIAKYKDNSSIVKTIKAYITIEKEIDIDVIKVEAEKFLPEYMIPKSIIILNEIPVNKNGKYDRKKLQEL